MNVRRLISLAVLAPAVCAAATLTTGSVTPSSGTPNRDFKFYVTFTGAAPAQQVQVSIDGQSFPMATIDTTPADGAKYAYITRLSISTSCYHFYFFQAVAADGSVIRYPSTGSKKGAKTGVSVTGMEISPTNPADGATLPNNTTYLKAKILPASSCDAYTAKLYWLKDGWTSWKYKTMSQSSAATDYDTYRATLYPGYDRSRWDINPGDSFQYFFRVEQYDGGTKKVISVPPATPLRLSIGGGGVYDGVAFNAEEAKNALEILNTGAYSQLLVGPEGASQGYDYRAWPDLNTYSDCGLDPDPNDAWWPLCNGRTVSPGCSLGSGTLTAVRERARIWVAGSGRGTDTVSYVWTNRTAMNGSAVTFDRVVVASKVDGTICARIQDPAGTDWLTTCPDPWSCGSDGCPGTYWDNWLGKEVRLRGTFSLDAAFLGGAWVVKGGGSASCGALSYLAPAAP